MGAGTRGPGGVSPAASHHVGAGWQGGESGRTETAWGLRWPGREGRQVWLDRGSGRGVLAGRILAELKGQDGGWCLVMTGCKVLPREAF